MESTITVLIILCGTLLLAVALDRGIPNLLDSLAYHFERLVSAAIAALRRSAIRMRERHARIAQQNRTRTINHAILAAQMEGQLR